eukprot:6308687-Amphidinium_carterae.1
MIHAPCYRAWARSILSCRIYMCSSRAALAEGEPLCKGSLLERPSRRFSLFITFRSHGFAAEPCWKTLRPCALYNINSVRLHLRETVVDNLLLRPPAPPQIIEHQKSR